MAGLVRDWDMEYPSQTGIDFDTLYDQSGLASKDFTFNPQSQSDFGWNNKTLGTVFGGVQALTGLANAYLGYKNYQLAKQQFGFQKGLANRNLANQAKIINNAYDNAAQVAAGMVGSRDSYGNYGMTNQAIVDKYAAKAKEKHVDGSAI